MVGMQGDGQACQLEGKSMGRWVGRLMGGYAIG